MKLLQAEIIACQSAFREETDAKESERHHRVSEPYGLPSNRAASGLRDIEPGDRKSLFGHKLMDATNDEEHAR